MRSLIHSPLFFPNLYSWSNLYYDLILLSVHLMHIQLTNKKKKNEAPTFAEEQKIRHWGSSSTLSKLSLSEALTKTS